MVSNLLRHVQYAATVIRDNLPPRSDHTFESHDEARAWLQANWTRGNQPLPLKGGLVKLERMEWRTGGWLTRPDGRLTRYERGQLPPPAMNLTTATPQRRGMVVDLHQKHGPGFKHLATVWFDTGNQATEFSQRLRTAPGRQVELNGKPHTVDAAVVADFSVVWLIGEPVKPFRGEPVNPVILPFVRNAVVLDGQKRDQGAGGGRAESPSQLHLSRDDAVDRLAQLVIVGYHRHQESPILPALDDRAQKAVRAAELLADTAALNDQALTRAEAREVLARQIGTFEIGSLIGCGAWMAAKKNVRNSEALEEQIAFGNCLKALGCEEDDEGVGKALIYVGRVAGSPARKALDHPELFNDEDDSLRAHIAPSDRGRAGYGTADNGLPGPAFLV